MHDGLTNQDIAGSHPSAVEGRATNFLIQDTAVGAETLRYHESNILNEDEAACMSGI